MSMQAGWVSLATITRKLGATCAKCWHAALSQWDVLAPQHSNKSSVCVPGREINLLLLRQVTLQCRAMGHSRFRSGTAIA